MPQTWLFETDQAQSIVDLLTWALVSREQSIQSTVQAWNLLRVLSQATVESSKSDIASVAITIEVEDR